MTKGGFSSKLPSDGRQSKNEPSDPKKRSQAPWSEQKRGSVAFRGVAKPSPSVPQRRSTSKSATGSMPCWPGSENKESYASKTSSTRVRKRRASSSWSGDPSSALSKRRRSRWNTSTRIDDRSRGRARHRSSATVPRELS